MTLISLFGEKNGILEIHELKMEKIFWHLTKEVDNFLLWPL